MTRWFSLDPCSSVERREAGKLSMETRGGCRVQQRRFMHTISKKHTHIYALHAKDMANLSPSSPNSDTSTHTVIYFLYTLYHPCQYSGWFLHTPYSQKINHLRAIEFGSSFPQALEMFALDTLSLCVALLSFVSRLLTKLTELTGG